MKIIRRARVQWNGDVESGSGEIALGSKAFTGPYSLRARVEDVPQANPEELIGAANAACFAMSLSDLLTKNGMPPNTLDVAARVVMEEDGGRFSITLIELTTTGTVPGCDAETFGTLAEQAKATCPISRALAGTAITLSAQLSGGAQQ